MTGGTELHDSYCGICCGACSVLVHGVTGQSDGFTSCLKAIPAAELACLGCKSELVYGGCRNCSIRSCAKERAVSHCCECSSYPCAMYSKWEKASRFLPHVREAATNLSQIRQHGVDAWVEAQTSRWACPRCGTRFSWYAAACGQCGQNLRPVTYELTGLRRLLCRFLLPIVYRKGKAKAEPSTGAQPKGAQPKGLGG